jgi:hypothetical protein
MSVGTVIFQHLDEKLAIKSYREVFMFVYSLISTIGWGDLNAGNQSSRIFCVGYTLIGVPIFYSTMANIGKILSDLYTVDWVYFTAVVRGKVR